MKVWFNLVDQQMDGSRLRMTKDVGPLLAYVQTTHTHMVLIVVMILLGRYVSLKCGWDIGEDTSIHF